MSCIFSRTVSADVREALYGVVEMINKLGFLFLIISITSPANVPRWLKFSECSRKVTSPHSCIPFDRKIAHKCAEVIKILYALRLLCVLPLCVKPVPGFGIPSHVWHANRLRMYQEHVVWNFVCVCVCVCISAHKRFVACSDIFTGFCTV